MILLVASDTNISGLAGLLHLEWILRGYQWNYCSPGGAVVFELRQSQRSGAYIVGASYVAQKMNQLRNRTPLTLAAPPASAPLFIPGCSGRNATFHYPLADFVTVMRYAIELPSADETDSNH